MDDPAVAAQAQMIRPHFDPAFYLARYPDIAAAGIDPALHYCLKGWREGRDPHPEFDTAGYLAARPELAALDMNPLLHFALARQARGQGAAAAPSYEADFIRPHFDADFYLSANPEVAAAGLDPVLHYCLHGWREGRRPRSDFDTSAHLAAHPEVAGLGLNPFVHFLIRQTTAEAAPAAPVPLAQQIDILRPHFDAPHYLAQSPEVAAAGIDPLEHYCTFGWAEGRDPAPGFSTRHYLDSNPDVARAGINPFVHYITSGQAEGRAPRHPGGEKAEQLRDQMPLEQMVAQWRKHRSPPDSLIGASDLLSALRAALSAAHRLVISVGHDDYRRVTGGVQLCIQHEARRARDLGLAYLNIHPADPLPRLAHIAEDPDPLICLVLDGCGLGACRMSVLQSAIERLRPAPGAVRVTIHHLMGHLPERIAALVRACGNGDCHLWLHDFFTLCPSFALQRNGVDFCAAPAPGSNACTLCLYGAERVPHRRRMRAFFEDLSVHLLSPSEGTARFWTTRSGLVPASLRVQPHMVLDWSPRARAPKGAPPSAPVTVGFAGMPSAHKGWPRFQHLFRRFVADPAFRFVYFGIGPVPIAGLTHIPVHVSAEAPDAMIRAMQAEGVDLVLHWTRWPETFSFSTYETLAAGAFVLTNPGSGNVAAMVEETGRGVVLRDADDLDRAFADGRVMALAAQARELRQRHDARHALGDMTLAVLHNQGAMP